MLKNIDWLPSLGLQAFFPYATYLMANIKLKIDLEKLTV